MTFMGMAWNKDFIIIIIIIIIIIYIYTHEVIWRVISCADVYAVLSDKSTHFCFINIQRFASNVLFRELHEPYYTWTV